MISNTYGVALSNNYITQTIDGGITWTQIPSPNNINFLDIICWDISNIIVIGSNKLYKTINNGLSWFDISGNYNNTNITAISFINDTGYIGCLDGKLYKSTDYGYNFNLISNNFLYFNKRITSIFMINKNYFYINFIANGDNNYIATSQNGGKSFIFNNQSLVPNNTYIYNFIYCITNNNLYRGTNITSLTSIYTYATFNLTSMIVQNNLIIIATSGNTFLISTNYGSTFTSYPIPFIINKLVKTK
jgi:hypothetical protein